jgi:hypothetical protein
LIRSRKPTPFTQHTSTTLSAVICAVQMSTFGHLFRVTTYGESHCASVGCIVDGCPPGMALEAADIQVQLSRRRPGQSALTTPRDEKDVVHIQSGCERGVTLGTPIGLLVKNEDQRPHDYSETDLYPRPSHADYSYLQKYGIKASSGGGRSSARETIGTHVLSNDGRLTTQSANPTCLPQDALLLEPSQRNTSRPRTGSRSSRSCPPLARCTCPAPSRRLPWPTMTTM